MRSDNKNMPYLRSYYEISSPIDLLDEVLVRNNNRAQGNLTNLRKSMPGELFLSKNNILNDSFTTFLPVARYQTTLAKKYRCNNAKSPASTSRMGINNNA